MAFPPNYSQDRNQRARNKAQKALDKRLKKEEGSDRRKATQQVTPSFGAAPAPEGKPSGDRSSE